MPRQQHAAAAEAAAACGSSSMRQQQQHATAPACDRSDYGGGGGSSTSHATTIFKTLPGRLESPTLRLTASRSNQLSYGSMYTCYQWLGKRPAMACKWLASCFINNGLAMAWQWSANDMPIGLLAYTCTYVRRCSHVCMPARMYVHIYA